MSTTARRPTHLQPTAGLTLLSWLYTSGPLRVLVWSLPVSHTCFCPPTVTSTTCTWKCVSSLPSAHEAPVAQQTSTSAIR